MASRPRRLVAHLGAAIVGVLLLAGCGAPEQQLSAGVREAVSTVQSARLALQLDDDGSSTDALTATAMADAVTAISATESTLTQIQADDAASARDQLVALNLVGQARDDLLGAQRAVAGTAGAPSNADVRSDLESTVRDLKRLATSLKAPR